MFFERFEQVCHEKDRSPSDVVLAVGMSKSNITSWKNGASPTLDTLECLAGELGVSVADLLPERLWSSTTPEDTRDTREEKHMTASEIIGVLERQLQLLSERSRSDSVTNRDLAAITSEMLDVAEHLLEWTLPI